MTSGSGDFLLADDGATFDPDGSVHVHQWIETEHLDSTRPAFSASCRTCPAYTGRYEPRLADSMVIERRTEPVTDQSQE